LTNLFTKSFSVRYLFFIQIAVLSLAACQGGEKPSDCPTSPSAIFSPDLAGVESQDFIQTGKDGLEVVSFSNGVFLEVYQSGCDSLRQEFRFRLPSPPPADAPGAWLAETQNQFRFFGSLGPEYAPFSQWADALSGFEEDFRLGQPMEAAGGFWVQIDKIDSFDGPALVVLLANFEL
jgi:hypothetical protein